MRQCAVNSIKQKKNLVHTYVQFLVHTDTLYSSLFSHFNPILLFNILKNKSNFNHTGSLHMLLFFFI